VTGISQGSYVAYKKKNTESNVVNQSFSFLSSDKSKYLVKRYFRDEETKIEEYYRIMAKLKQSNKKYINRIYLKRLLAFENKTEF
jgi:hypothetical protein